MVSWATVVVACSIVGLIYFLVRGIRIAMSNKEPPDPEEGDYEIKLLGKLRGGRFLAIMTRRVQEPKSTDDDKDS